METLGARRMAPPIAMALSPTSKLLAAAAARGDGDFGGGGSRLEILRLWRGEKDPEKGRELEVVASISDCGGEFHRLAWSRAFANSRYSLGLLAGGLDDGVVTVWDPAELSYEPGFDAISGGVLVDESFPLGLFAGGLFCDPSKMSYVSYGKEMANEFHKPNISKEVEQAVLKMTRKVEDLYLSQLVEEVSDESSLSPKESSVADDWLLLQGESDSEMEDWELVSKDQAKEVCKGKLISHKESGFLHKMSGLTGPVHGLAFNNQYGNMLAAAARGDKLNIYHIDCPVRDSTSTYEFLDFLEKAKNAQVTFLEWHPQYPAILASTCDAGITTIWDIRQRHPGIRVNQEVGYCSEVHWQPNNVLGLATASRDSSEPVKVWDLSRPNKPTHTFGPRKGVNSLSWSLADDLILTTGTSGEVEWWKLNDKESADPCGACTTAASSEARWCESEGVFALASSGGVGLCKLLKPWRTSS